MKHSSGIYGILCKPTGKIYIGSAVKFGRRWMEHRTELRNGNHHSKHLQNAWNKRGENNFVFIVLEIVKRKESLVETEQKYIDLFDSADNSRGFNMSPKAGSVMLGRKHSDKVRAAMSARFKGCTLTEDHKRKIGLANTGNKHTPQIRKQIALKQCKIKPEQIYEVRTLIEAKMSYRKIAAQFGCSIQTICNIKHGKRQVYKETP